MMNSRIICLTAIILIVLSYTLNAQKGLDYYLPSDVTFDKSIPTPKNYLGWEIGKWHINHTQLVGYLNELAQRSDRITIQKYGKSHEDRPLVVLTITSPQNQTNIEKIQSEHVALTDASKSASMDISKMPVVVYMGYSVHGNEASGGNAVPLMAYYLAAAQGSEIENILNETVILLDPCFNPDGFNRFASWVNTHKSKHPNPDPYTREHQEAWPGGRTNHYWFDLNRDWLLVQHPESRGRIKMFQSWKPNILTDHHEMGSNATFFFQPGIPSRTNPLTPDINQELTKQIAEYHARELDEIGSLYYAEESFDDFYYGKGSTYPDVQGCIGILFEQASSRGHTRSTIHGEMDFPFTIKNQFLTSLSTMKAAYALRTDLLNYQKNYFQQTAGEAARERVKGVVFGDQNDPARATHLADIISHHDIDVHQLTNDLSTGGKYFKSRAAYYIPYQQKQYRLIKAMFEKRTSFRDSLFYDVSAWTFQLAFDLDYAEVGGAPQVNKEPVSKVEFPDGKIIGEGDTYAYLVEWNQYYAPSLAYDLMKKGSVVKVANKPFTMKIGGSSKNFKRGTLLVPATQVGLSKQQVKSMIENTSDKNGVTVYSVSTGFTPEGIDLGSPSFSKLRDPKVLMLIGRGARSYDAGEVWHLLDERFNMGATLCLISTFSSLDLSKYRTLILVDGNYSSIGNIDKLKEWVAGGGTIVAMKGAVKWLNTTGLTSVEMKKKSPVKGQREYGNLSNERGAQVIGGSICDTRIDLTHPLGYGYSDNQLPVFRRGTDFFKPAENPYATPIRYTSNPLLAGYISKENEALLKNSASAIIYRHGGGRIVCLADNPNFRAYWYGTTKVFMNSIFFGHTISSSASEVPKPKGPKSPATKK